MPKFAIFFFSINKQPKLKKMKITIIITINSFNNLKINHKHNNINSCNFNNKRIKNQF